MTGGAESEPVEADAWRARLAIDDECHLVAVFVGAVHFTTADRARLRIDRAVVDALRAVVDAGDFRHHHWAELWSWALDQYDAGRPITGEAVSAVWDTTGTPSTSLRYPDGGALELAHAVHRAGLERRLVLAADELTRTDSPAHRRHLVAELARLEAGLSSPTEAA